MKPACPECGEQFSANGGGHCRGGAHGGCCQTFSSNGAFDAHRTGDYAARTCIPVLACDHWRQLSTGWTHYPPREFVPANTPTPTLESA